jgi:biofilm PGA synthesis N-glycosyltransferase PgaC
MRLVSIGVCAYNEERNIGACLASLIKQQLHDFDLVEMIVVSSGSTDRTDEVVKEFQTREARIQLLRQERREGKNSAVNLFLGHAKGDILVLANADNQLADGTLQKLLDHFADDGVGVVGGRPVPINRKDDLAGFAVHMLWDMHHRVSLIHPKVGELIAFRRLDKQLPLTTQSDEDIIRMELERKGLRTEYEPDAIVFNKGPANLRDFVKQRTRVNIGEKYMKRLYDYDIPTWDSRFLFASFLSFLQDNRAHPFLVLGAMGLEAYARLYATVYVALDKGDQAVWQQVGSTKDLSDQRNDH